MEFLLTFYLFNLATSLFRQLKTEAEDFPTFYEAPVSVMQFFLQFLCMSKWFFYIWGGIPWNRWNQWNRHRRHTRGTVTAIAELLFTQSFPHQNRHLRNSLVHHHNHLNSTVRPWRSLSKVCECTPFYEDQDDKVSWEISKQTADSSLKILSLKITRCRCSR